MTKENVTELLNRSDISDEVRRVLEIRQQLGKTSIKKYVAMKTAEGEGERVRGLTQFYGANRTGRWAGRLVQMQNLPRNYLKTLDEARKLVKAKNYEGVRLIYGNVPDTLSQLIRTAFIPSEGRKFVVADFSAIEARVIAWLAGEQWVNEVFATHGKIYEATASQMFHVPIERITKGNPEYSLRQKGKVATLALGYQGGSNALIVTNDADSTTTCNQRTDLCAGKRSCVWATLPYSTTSERKEAFLPETIFTGESVRESGDPLLYCRSADKEMGSDVYLWWQNDREYRAGNRKRLSCGNITKN